MPDFLPNNFISSKKAIQRQFRHDQSLYLFIFCPFPAIPAENRRTGTTPAGIFHPSAGC